MPPTSHASGRIRRSRTGSACGSSAIICARAPPSTQCRSPSCSAASICRRRPKPIASSPYGEVAMRVFLLGIAILAVAGCKQAPAEHSAVTRAEATRIAEQAEANFTTGKAEDVIRQYAEGAVIFDAGHPNFSTDRKVQTGWARDFVSMKPADYHVPDRQIQLI